jgi:hypothetical protein
MDRSPPHGDFYPVLCYSDARAKGTSWENLYADFATFHQPIYFHQFIYMCSSRNPVIRAGAAANAESAGIAKPNAESRGISVAIRASAFAGSVARRRARAAGDAGRISQAFVSRSAAAL